MAHIPMRMCTACRERRAKDELIRIVKTERGIAVDKNQNILARGVYICRSEKCVSLAKKKKALARQFKENTDDSVYDMLLTEVSNG